MGFFIASVHKCRLTQASVAHMDFVEKAHAEQGGGLIIHHGLIMRITIYKRPIPIQELRAEEGGGLIIHHGLIIHTIWYILQ